MIMEKHTDLINLIIMLEHIDIEYSKTTCSSNEDEWCVDFNSNSGNRYCFIFDKDTGNLNRII